MNLLRLIRYRKTPDLRGKRTGLIAAHGDISLAMITADYISIENIKWITMVWYLISGRSAMIQVLVRTPDTFLPRAATGMALRL